MEDDQGDDDDGRSIVTSAEARPTVGGNQPSALQVAAARLVIAARKLGDTTPEWIERVDQGLPPRREL